MAKEYEQTKSINVPPDEAFAWLANVGNLPHYLPPVKEAGVEGQSVPGTPGRRIRLRVEIPDRGEFPSEGYLSVDEGARRMEWGAETERDYSGWLTVAGNGGNRSEVTVHLNFGEVSAEGQIQEESSEQRDPLEESLAATLESIRSQLEEGAGKEAQPPQTG